MFFFLIFFYFFRRRRLQDGASHLPTNFFKWRKAKESNPLRFHPPQFSRLLVTIDVPSKLVGCGPENRTLSTLAYETRGVPYLPASVAERQGFEPRGRIHGYGFPSRCNTIMRSLLLDTATGLEPAIVGLQSTALPTWLRCVIQTTRQCILCCAHQTYVLSDKIIHTHQV